MVSSLTGDEKPQVTLNAEQFKSIKMLGLLKEASPLIRLLDL
jgi:hypothetical protein